MQEQGQEEKMQEQGVVTFETPEELARFIGTLIMTSTVTFEVTYHIGEWQVHFSGGH